MPKTGRYCCVPGCTNHEQFRVDDRLQFHRFPGKPYEVQRRRLWILALNRKNNDGSLWLPTNDSRICSKHFLGGRKSDIESDAGYIPSIFPSTDKESIPIPFQSKFAELSDIENDHTYTEAPLKRSRYDIVNKRKKIRDSDHKTTQICYFGTDGKITTSMQGNPGQKPPENGKISNKSSDPSNYTVICRDFHGIDDLQNEADLHNFTGVSQDTFKTLLTIINSSNPQVSTFLSQDNVLLLFLMKMKFGMPFKELSVFFNVHRTTVSRIFAYVLEILTNKTEKYIFWPEIDLVQQHQPEIFQNHYPNTRVIIDVIRIKTDQPLANFDRKTTIIPRNQHSLKVVLGLNTNGFVCFKSKCYPGTIDDTDLIRESGIFDFLQTDDVVLINRDMPNVEENLTEGVILVALPIVDQVKTYIDGILHKILDFNILKTIPINLFRYIDHIVQLACILNNLSLPMVHENT